MTNRRHESMWGRGDGNTVRGRRSEQCPGGAALLHGGAQLAGLACGAQPKLQDAPLPLRDRPHATARGTGVKTGPRWSPVVFGN